ncbi:MAG: hypothetical protein WD607_00745 [Candidatus Paceibacterota bacterium]
MININIEGDAWGNNISIPQGTQESKNLFEEISSSLIRIQGSKYSFRNENGKNDALRNSLLDKGFCINDQMRNGRSGSKNEVNFDCGELDIVICDCENNSEIISIVEALELDSLGEKNKIVKSHINKLLYSYDTAGNNENFLVIYSMVKKFDRLWEKYKQHINNVIFPDEVDLFEIETSKSDIRGGYNYYLRNGKKLKLSHLFVNMYKGGGC